MKRISASLYCLIFLSIVLSACNSPTDYDVDRWKKEKKDTTTTSIAKLQGGWDLIEMNDSSPAYLQKDEFYTLSFFTDTQGKLSAESGFIDGNFTSHYSVQEDPQNAGQPHPLSFFDYHVNGGNSGTGPFYIYMLQNADSFTITGDTLMIYANTANAVKYLKFVRRD